ncbi:MAG: transcriptional regulator NrdR [Oscillospiraceae bacterium]
MRCPFCDYEDTKVIDSRPADGKKRRRRECTNCGKRFTTYESVEMPLLMVLKRDGTYEPFDRNKLIKGIYSAIKKRPVSVDMVDKMVDDVENYYANAMQNQASSTEIGDMILEKLEKIDLVAYVRFASVYKDFTDVQSFIKIISELGSKKK